MYFRICDCIKASGQTPEAPHPGTDQLAVPMSPSSDRRPGSNVKAVLPPIPAGRKTPSVPNVAPSPRFSSHTAVRDGGEEGDAAREG